MAVLGGVTYLAYELWGPFGFRFIVLPFVRKPFDRGVEKVTGGYAAILRRIVTRRMLTMVVVGGFAAGIVVVNTQLPTGFIPLEDQGMIYGIIQTPPGSTLEYTNAKSHELQAIAKKIEGVTSVTSLAGYEVLTEGRGSNAGTCLINLKTWSDRKLTVDADHRGARGKMPRRSPTSSSSSSSRPRFPASARPAASPCASSTRRTPTTTSGSEK